MRIAAASLAEVGYCIHASRRLGYVAEDTENELETSSSSPASQPAHPSYPSYLSSPSYPSYLSYLSYPSYQSGIFISRGDFSRSRYRHGGPCNCVN